jgi:hypothetical protein
MNKRLVNCSKSPNYTKAKTATPLRAGSEAAREPSSAAATAISAVGGECNARKNTSFSAAAVSGFKTGKSSPLKRTSDLYFDSVNQTENSQLDELLARAIFSSGSPLSLFENEDWMTFMEKLRQIYKLASRSTLRNKLLENEYQQVEALVKTKLAEASVLLLQTDAWSNQRNESAVRFFVTTLSHFFSPRPWDVKPKATLLNIWELNWTTQRQKRNPNICSCCSR